VIHFIEDIPVEGQETLVWCKVLGGFVDVPLPKAGVDLG
jgi:hypothetical protein